MRCSRLLRSPGPKAKRSVSSPILAQGSAFFLSRSGLFMTAKHVVSRYDSPAYSVVAVHRGQRAWSLCPVVQLALHPSIDVAVGIARLANGSDWPHPFLLCATTLSERVPATRRRWWSVSPCT